MTPAPIAALPMYDPPGLQAANDALWSAIAGRLGQDGVAAPARLTRSDDLDGLWVDPGLLLAQTCGYPLATRLKGRVRVVATPAYDAPGCAGPGHRAAIVVRAGSGVDGLAALRGRRCAVNAWDSNTGMNLLRARIAPLAEAGRFFGTVTITGAHAASLAAVAEGRADAAAIDAVSLALLADLDPGLARAVEILDWTDESPGLPLITAAGRSEDEVGALRRALAAVAADPALAPVRTALRLTGFTIPPEGTYARILGFEDEARRLGYPELA